MNVTRIRTFEVATDLLLSSGLPSIVRETSRNDGSGTGRRTLQARVRLDGTGSASNSTFGVDSILPQKWTPLFSIKIFQKEHQDIKPENFKLNQQVLTASPS